jgi:serralysin
MNAQGQAAMAGVPFDILTESDLNDINKLKDYDAIVFPSFSNVKSADYAAIVDTLEIAVRHYGIGIITSGNFMTNNENGGLISADPYFVMRELLDVVRTTGGFPADVSLNAGDITHAITDDYTTNELVREYTGVGWSAFDDVSGNGRTLITQTVGGNEYSAVIATETGGRNVHFSSESVMADNNLLWQSIDWAVNGDGVTVGLQMSRQKSIFASRNDMDQSQQAGDVDPPGAAIGIYDKLVPILQDWKTLYNFVGSYYINVGNHPTEQETHWAVSNVWYNQMLALGNEIGSHSYTHPENTNLLFPNVVTQEMLDDRIAQYQALLGTSDRVYTPYVLRDDANPTIVAQLAALSLGQINSRIAAALASPNPSALGEVDKALLESTYTFQFERARDVILANLPGSNGNAAVPGATEELEATLQMLQYVTTYLSGGISMTGAGYPGAIGYVLPDQQDKVYLAPNVSFDFTLVGFQGMTAAQALAKWQAEFAALTAHGDVPVVVWPWHDYGPTNWTSRAWTLATRGRCSKPSSPRLTMPARNS